MYTIRVTEQPALDAKWYERLTTILAAIPEVFVLLEPSQEKLQREQQKFSDSGNGYSPDLRPDGVDQASLMVARMQLAKLAADISAYEPQADIQAAYLARIAECSSGIRMVTAACQGDSAEFVAANQQIYGQPDRTVFAAACAWIRQNAADTVAGSPYLQQLQIDLLGVVPDLPGADVQLLMPSETLFHRVRNRHFTAGGYVDSLFGAAGLPQQPYIEQQAGDDICRQAISTIGSDARIASSSDGIWAVLQSSGQVLRPEGYRLDRDEFAGIVCHEIGSHLLESANGSKQPLRLLGLGLDGFEAGNEGRAFLREQIMYQSEAEFTRQSSWEYILLLYLGVCLGSGMNGQPYNFGQLYAVMYALHNFLRQRRYPLASNNDTVARQEAWLICVRIMKGLEGKGLDGQVQPGCYMKDMVYLEGNLACWQAAAKNPDLILAGDKGKFDITNARHLQILSNLQILPKMFI